MDYFYRGITNIDLICDCRKHVQILEIVFLQEYRKGSQEKDMNIIAVQI